VHCVTLFVYGSLKRGFANADRLDGAVFVRRARTAPGYRLHVVGGYPALVAAGGGVVCGEVYGVTVEHLAALDAFEGVPSLYERASVELDDGETAEAYVMSEARVSGYAIVPGDEWVEGRR